MIRRVIRSGLVIYEKDEADLKQEALLEIARIELEEKDAEKKSERVSAVLNSVDNALRALGEKAVNPAKHAGAEKPSKAE